MGPCFFTAPENSSTGPHYLATARDPCLHMRTQNLRAGRRAAGSGGGGGGGGGEEEVGESSVSRKASPQRLSIAFVASPAPRDKGSSDMFAPSSLMW